MRIIRSLHLRNLLMLVTLLALLMPAGVSPLAQASHTPNPANVSIPGSLQSELGCPGDWQPECATTQLTYEAGDDVWQGT